MAKAQSEDQQQPIVAICVALSRIEQTNSIAKGVIMSVRKRRWTTTKGQVREAWVVDYADQQGDRHIETFERKKDAEAREAEVTFNIGRGVHTPENKSITVAQAADDWISYIEAEGRERSTIDQYRQHIRHHIGPRLGREKLARLTSPRVNAFRDELIKDISRAMPKGNPQGRQAARQRRSKRGGGRFDHYAGQDKAKA